MLMHQKLSNLTSAAEHLQVHTSAILNTPVMSKEYLCIGYHYSAYEFLSLLRNVGHSQIESLWPLPIEW